MSAPVTTRRRLTLALAGLACSPALANQTPAPESPGAAGSIPSSITEALTRPRLAGEGRLRWYGFHVYDARLFVPAEGIDPARYSGSAFALELRYARQLQGEDIAQASAKEMTRMGFGTESLRAAWLQTMRALFPDVVAGDRLTGIHQADRRVLFYRNDTRIGRIEDRQFGEAFFGIWLDPRTVVPDLRRELLRNPGRDPGQAVAR
jgi:hypothetical protein